MHPHSAHATVVTPIPAPPPDLTLVMYRLDQVVAETHKLRQEMKEGFAQVHDEIRTIHKDQDNFRQELADHRVEHQRIRSEFKDELNAHRVEFKDELNAHRVEFKEALHAQRLEFKKSIAEMMDRNSAEMEKMLDRVLGTVDDRIKISGQASDLRLFKWCAGSAATSSAATSGLAYAISRFLS